MRLLYKGCHEDVIENIILALLLSLWNGFKPLEKKALKLLY